MDANSPDGTIELTPSMMQAGLEVLQEFMDQDIKNHAAVQFAVVERIFLAMNSRCGISKA